MIEHKSKFIKEFASKIIKIILQHFQIDGEVLRANATKKYWKQYFGQEINLGIVKMYWIGQSAAKLLKEIMEKVQRLNVSGFELQSNLRYSLLLKEIHRKMGYKGFKLSNHILFKYIKKLNLYSYLYYYTTMTKKCTNCNSIKELSEFISKRGGETLTCLICREKDSKRKNKPGIKEKRQNNQRNKKYYIKYREKKKKDNEQEYLEHNAIIAKNWRDNNKEHLSKYRTINFNTRLSAIKQQAKKKGIFWNDNMTISICKNLMESKCFYCGFLSNETLNGIDRMDSSSDYKIENCVSCCKICNFIKKCLDPNTFIKRCMHISYIFNDIGKLYKDSWIDSGSVSYNAYQSRANKKNLDFLLSKDQFNNIKSQNCYYCHKENTNTHKNGIDRKNNLIGYIENNCITCCRECNQMKSNLSDINFINHCKKVSTYIYSNNVIIPEIKECLYTIKKRKN